jgi:hypothetical protein
MMYYFQGAIYKTFCQWRNSVNAYKLASQVSGKRAPLTVPYQMMKVMSVMMTPFDSFLPESLSSYSSEGLRVVAGVTYWGDNSKAKRELGFNPRPVSEGWVETVKNEVNLLEK